MDLSYITRTEYYAGLFKSSAKITMYLTSGAGTNGAPASGSSNGSTQGTDDVFESWECEVCGNRNPPGLSPTAARICALCGVPRSSVPIPIKTPAAAAPSSRPASPDLGDEGGGGEGNPATNMMKLSFRKGGDKAFYAVLKRSLMGKAWEVSIVLHLVTAKMWMLMRFLYLFTTGKSHRQGTFQWVRYNQLDI
jgi:hypothetical protein